MYWAFACLLVLHAPTFYQWIMVPLVIFVMEKTARAISTMVGQGRTCIVQGTTMASRLVNQQHVHIFRQASKTEKSQ